MGREVPLTVILTFDVRYRPVIRIDRDSGTTFISGCKILVDRVRDLSDVQFVISTSASNEKRCYPIDNKSKSTYLKISSVILPSGLVVSLRPVPSCRSPVSTISKSRPSVCALFFMWWMKE